ncbi:MAG: hypothetical protein PHD07_04940 [Bacteroidales bacterium]|nr:hypothetical protein [Bacteroidales bacterium]
MKKYIIISVIALSAIFNAQAQGSKTITYPTALEINQAQALWFNTSNAAGMIVTPLNNYNTLSVGYNVKNGEYRLQQEGNQQALKINTSGATNLGKARLWGEFTYQNITETDTRYNTTMLDVVPDMPYFVGDPNISYWKKQSYNMSVKAASPVLWDLVAFGASANYFTKNGAKQIDPRSESFKYGISVEPAVVFTLGTKHSIGLTFLYLNSFERTVPVNSNNQQDQIAYIMRGVGNYTDGVVGSLSGMGTFYYKTNKIGTSLQYNFNGDRSALLAEVKSSFQVVDVFQTPTKPRRMGTTAQMLMGGNIQYINNGDDFTSKVTLDGYHKNNNGIEYIQEIDATYEVQQWVTIAKFIRSRYVFNAATLKFDLYRNSDEGYDWMAGAQGIFSDRTDEYILPHSTFTAKNVYGELFGKKNIMAGDNSVLIGINAGYNFNLGGGYDYNGAEPTSKVVKDLYERDNAILCANYYQVGLDIKASFPIGKSTALYIAGNCQYLRSNDTMNDNLYACDNDGSNFRWEYKTADLRNPSQRVIATISIGFTF